MINGNKMISFSDFVFKMASEDIYINDQYYINLICEGDMYIDAGLAKFAISENHDIDSIKESIQLCTHGIKVYSRAFYSNHIQDVYQKMIEGLNYIETIASSNNDYNNDNSYNAKILSAKHELFIRYNSDTSLIYKLL